ncbi:MAG: SDR family NAD(P)-dependent oxidoreductase, partial [Polaribacter sp.]
MKKVIITGTSRGIGFELAKQYAESGHQVLAISRNSEPLSAVNHKNITVLSVDISNPHEVLKIVAFVKNEWKKVDILINNAGKLINKPFTEISSKEFLEVYKVNVFAVAEITKLMIPFLQKGSHVVTISSMGGVQGTMKFPGLAAYSSAKGA